MKYWIMEIANIAFGVAGFVLAAWICEWLGELLGTLVAKWRDRRKQ